MANLKRGHEVKVDELRDCDFQDNHPAGPTPAAYDGKTYMGPWANMCEGCFEIYGIGTGLGLGQKLVLRK